VVAAVAYNRMKLSTLYVPSSGTSLLQPDLLFSVYAAFIRQML
jgi:hypothetical protein